MRSISSRLRPPKQSLGKALKEGVPFHVIIDNLKSLFIYIRSKLKLDSVIAVTILSQDG
jgi:hypothetical protein